MFHRLGSYWRFIRKQRQFLILGIVVFIALAIFVGFTNQPVAEGETSTLWEGLSWWGDWIDPIIGVGIFIVSIIIGRTQFIEDWEQSLDKRLTVIFKHEGRDIMVCEKAFLADTADIRGLGQQIGSQMADNNRNLKFAPNNIQSDYLGVEKNEEVEKEFFMHYQVVFVLLETPELKSQPNDIFKTKYLRWPQPEIIDKLFEGKTKKEKEEIENNQFWKAYGSV